jgi:hypothetical protein
LHAGRLQDTHPVSSRPRIRQQGRLPHPRFTCQDQDTAPAREGISQKPVDDLGLSRSAYERQLAQRVRPSVSVNHKSRQPEAAGSRRLRLQVSLIQH